MKIINVFEPKSEKNGAEVTLATSKGRKTFHLKRPHTSNEQPPLAIESFAVDPEHYAKLMKRVESLNSFSK
jgi:tRNA-dihydrouridine synthase